MMPGIYTAHPALPLLTYRMYAARRFSDKPHIYPGLMKSTQFLLRGFTHV